MVAGVSKEFLDALAEDNMFQFHGARALLDEACQLLEAYGIHPAGDLAEYMAYRRELQAASRAHAEAEGKFLRAHQDGARDTLSGLSQAMAAKQRVLNERLEAQLSFEGEVGRRWWKSHEADDESEPES